MIAALFDGLLPLGLLRYAGPWERVETEKLLRDMFIKAGLEHDFVEARATTDWLASLRAETHDESRPN